MSVPHGVKKSTLDAWNGYHSVAIREEDRHLTTFLTPEGRFRYRTAPQGFLASGDGYTHRYDEITKNVHDASAESLLDDKLTIDQAITKLDTQHKEWKIQAVQRSKSW